MNAIPRRDVLIASTIALGAMTLPVAASSLAGPALNPDAGSSAGPTDRSSAAAGDPLGAMLREAAALMAVANSASEDCEARAAYDRASAIRHRAFNMRAVTPSGALACLEFARDEFARFHVEEGLKPDWMDCFTLNMLDSATGVPLTGVRTHA